MKTLAQEIICMVHEWIAWTGRYYFLPLALPEDMKGVNPSYTVWAVGFFSPMIQKKDNRGKGRAYWILIFFCLKHKWVHFGNGCKKGLFTNDILILNGFWKLLISNWTKFNLLHISLVSLALESRSFRPSFWRTMLLSWRDEISQWHTKAVKRCENVHWQDYTG